MFLMDIVNKHCDTSENPKINVLGSISMERAPINPNRIKASSFIKSAKYLVKNQAETKTKGIAN